MQLHKLSLSETHAFSQFFLDYIQKKETLKEFYSRYPSIENFKSQIEDKARSFPPPNRKILHDSIRSQYADLNTTEQVKTNISLLRDEKTFTITTGHQLNIFTGPLYFVYKIITVINAARELKKAYPGYNFVPVYWMASEDHDFDEIKYFRLYGKKYIWNTAQSGAVGRFSPNGLATLMEEIPGDIAVFRDAYTRMNTLADAVRFYVNSIFGEQGIVVVNPDDASLKGVIKDVMRGDIFDGVNKECVDKTTSTLEDLGYKTQVYCREINFFYLDEGIRERIEKTGDSFRVVESDLTFSRAGMEDLINEHPEKLSPNVILRPLFQELILPNLAYVGGPAEMVYWLQLKQMFDNHNVPFPILLPRNFAMIMDHEVVRKLDKTGLAVKDIFEEKNYLYNHWVLTNSPRNLTVGNERNEITSIFHELRSRAELVDKTLSPFVGAEGKRALNSLERIERKLLRAEKRLHADKLRQIEFVKDSLFPNGTLQERADNFLNFQQEHPEFLSQLYTALDPFDFRFNVLTI
jgi:bacillithiol biosynthesis cysteine-adding enzyme BshC